MRLGFAAFGWVVLLPLTAAAEPVVDWHAPSECPSASVARSKLASLLGKPLAKVGLKLTAAVRIERVAGSEFEATISVQAPRGKRDRRLRDRSCEVLSHAAAVVVALSIDPRARVVPPRVAPAPAPAPARGPSNGQSAFAAASPIPAGESTVTPAAPSGGADSSVQSVVASSSERSEAVSATDAVENEASEPEPQEARPAVAVVVPPESSLEESGAGPEIGLVFGLAAGFGAGTLPKLAPGFAASVGLDIDDFRAALRLSYALEQRAGLVSANGRGGNVALGSAGLEGAYRMRWSWFEVPLVAGVEGGVFDAVGDVPNRVRRLAPWASGYLGTGVAVAVGAWAFELRADGLASVLRPKFALEDRGGGRYVFHQPSQFGGRVFLGGEVRIP